MNYDFITNLFNSFYFFGFGQFDLNFVLWGLFAMITVILATAIGKWIVGIFL